MMKQKTKKSTKQHQVNCENPHCGFTFHITAPVQVPIYMLQLCTVLMWRRCVQQVLFPPWYSCIGTIQTNKWFLFKICRRHLFLDKPARLTIRVLWFLFLIVKSEVKKQIGRRWHCLGGQSTWENPHISFGKCLLNRSNQSILRCYIRLWCHFPSHKSNVRCREYFPLLEIKAAVFLLRSFRLCLTKRTSFILRSHFPATHAWPEVFLLIGRKALLRFSFSWKTIFSPAWLPPRSAEKTNKTFSDQLQKQCWKNLVVVTFRCETCADEIFNWICKMQAKWLKASL